MRNPFVYRAGGVLSADIAVPEHDREVKFYTQILTTGDAPLWRDDLTNNLGAPVIGLGVRTPEYETLPLQWMPHFQVTDVAASAKCAVDMGGTELMHAKSDDGPSQWAVLVDPDGAAFGVIPVVPEATDNDQQNKPLGCIAWLSLTVPDAQTSRDFYQRVLGWSGKPIEPGGEGQVARFEMQIDDETAAAEISQAQSPSQSQDDGIPAVWLIHLPVDDFAESLRLVRELDGQVVKECTDSKFAVIRDPVGSYLALQAGPSR